jgi:uncharacterized membrane protein YpjA
VNEAALQLDTNVVSWSPWVRFSRWVVMTPVVWLVVVVNVGSALAGFIYWYGPSIGAAPWYYWLFVPDSPLAVTFVSGALVAYHYGKRWDLLGLLASGTCVKYGLWTIFVWFTNYLWGGSHNLEAVTMSLTHLIMVVEGLVILPFLRFRPTPLAVASLFLIANDVVDYTSTRSPRVPFPDRIGTIAAFTIATTAIIVLSWIVMAWVGARARRRRHPGGGETGAARPHGSAGGTREAGVP